MVCVVFPCVAGLPAEDPCHAAGERSDHRRHGFRSHIHAGNQAAATQHTVLHFGL